MKKKLSPHVNVYKFPITAISSITTRLTGLSLSGIFIVSGLICYTDIDYNLYYNKLDNFSKSLINNSIIFSCTYHTFGGIRHFIWDKYPKLLTNNSVTRSSYLLFGTSLLTTFIIHNCYDRKNKYPFLPLPINENDNEDNKK